MKPKQPLYFQIASELESEIRRLYSAQDALPSELELAKRFDVNRHTIRKSIDKLVMKGLVRRRRGVGLFVAESKTIPYELNARSRVTGNFDTIGIKGDLKLTKRCLEVATMKDAAWLKCSPGEPLLMIETLRFADGIPFAWIQHKFLYARFPLIYQNYQSGSLHNFIRQHYAINLVRSKVVVNAKLSEDEEALMLKVELGRPLIRLRSLNVNEKNSEPIEFSNALLRGDIVELESHF
jgi:GntR family phosphonate transport system transcriptional regulator